MSWIALDPKDQTVKRIVNAAVPGFKGRKFYATIGTKVTFYGAYWDEGSKNDWFLIRLSDLACKRVEDHPYFRESPVHDATHDIPDGFAVVKYHRGRMDYVEIIAPPSAITPLLPKPVNLSRDESIVLVAHCSLKSSYAGISDYRRHEAKQLTGITDERYDAAKAALVAQGYINPRNAVTIEGRNARNGLEFTELYQYRPQRELIPS